MIDRDIDLKRLKLAKVRYYDAENNGAELSDIDAYAFLINVNGHYINLFDPIEELPVYDRTFYTNTTRRGDDFGTLIKHIDGAIEDGPCYILERMDLGRIFKGDTIKISELVNYIFKSDKFFVDRLNLYKENKGSLPRNTISKNKLKEDVLKMFRLEEYLNGHERTKVYKKN